MDKNLNSEQKVKHQLSMIDNISVLSFSSDSQSPIKTTEGLCDVQKSAMMSLDRELISRFGNAVFQCPEAVSVAIRVDFKDGSSVGFEKEKEVE